MENLKDPFTFWEGRFPGKGRALLKVMAQFQGWKPELKPVLPDLEVRVRKAVHWRSVGGSRTFKFSRQPLIFDANTESLGESLWAWSGPPSSPSPRGLLWLSIKESLESSLGVPLSDQPWISLWISLHFACIGILAGAPKQAAKFQPLLDLWLAGNFPIGFDKEENLLVLVGD